MNDALFGLFVALAAVFCGVGLGLTVWAAWIAPLFRKDR